MLEETVGVRAIAECAPLDRHVQQQAMRGAYATAGGHLLPRQLPPGGAFVRRPRDGGAPQCVCRVHQTLQGRFEGPRIALQPGCGPGLASQQVASRRPIDHGVPGELTGRVLHRRPQRRSQGARRVHAGQPAARLCQSLASRRQQLGIRQQQHRIGNRQPLFGQPAARGMCHRSPQFGRPPCGRQQQHLDRRHRQRALCFER